MQNRSPGMSSNASVRVPRTARVLLELIDLWCCKLLGLFSEAILPDVQALKAAGSAIPCESHPDQARGDALTVNGS